MKVSFRKIGVFLCCAFLAISSVAQISVDVNVDINHKVGEAGEFDRSKYVVLHEGIDGGEWESSAQRNELMEGYDVYFGRNNGSLVWEYNNSKEDPNKAGWPDVSYIEERGASAINTYKNKTEVHNLENRLTNMMMGGQEHMYPHGQATSIGGLTYAGHEATAEFFAQYFKNFFGEGGTTGKKMPKLLEVCNEPFVKADQLGVTRQTLAEYHNDVALRVKALNPELMVGGYSAAHPAFENNNNSFNLWEANWRMFIDVAGANMDFFSFHLYDFAQTTDDMAAEMYRSGSNIEAIMDMINHYSYLALGETKPWSVSEYGWLCKTCDGGYDIKEDWYNLRSFNNMMVQLMERPDQIINAIPFMILKAKWAHPEGEEYNTYGPRIMREIGELPGEEAHGGYIYTELIKYFEFWKNVNGTRVDTKSEDLDIMADAYIDGKKMYLILSNLEKGDEDIDLNLIGGNDNIVESIMVKHLYAVDDVPVLDTTYYNNAISSITLGSQATMILEYEFAEEVTIDQTTEEKTYWADRYKREILVGKTNTFTFENVTLADNGEAVLRLGMGREHGSDLNPSVEVNGTALEIPRVRDWRGYDQKTRDSYFGVIEIEVPYNLLVEGENVVKVSVIDGDKGGFNTSVGLQVFNFSRPVPRFDAAASLTQDEIKYRAFALQPNPAQDVVRITSDLDGLITYAIYTVNGTLVKQGHVSDKNINTEELNAGMYVVNLQSESYQQNLKLMIK